MYYWIWTRLPGNKFLKILQAILLTAGLVAVLYLQVFPWLDTVVFPETDTEI